MSSILTPRLPRACAGFVLALSLAACGGDSTGGGGPPKPEPVKVASVSVTGTPSSPLLTGSTVQLTATPLTAGGMPMSNQTITWSSGDTTIAKVAASGMVTAVGTGPVTITAAVGQVTGTAELDVRAGGPLGPEGGTLTVLDGAATIVFPPQALAQTLTLLVRPVQSPPASARMVAGTAYEVGPTTLYPQLRGTLTLRYDAARVPAGVQPASLQLYMLLGQIWSPVRGSTVDVASRTVTGPLDRPGTYAVLGTPAERLVMEGELVDGTLYVGRSGSLKATLFDVYGDTLRGRAVSWTSSDPARVTVSATAGGAGLLTALGTGTATITAEVDGRSTSTMVTGLARPVAAWNHGADWTTFQGNARHTGEVDAILDPSAFRELWTATVADGVALHPAATGDGRVFVSTDVYHGTQRLVMLDGRTGERRWSKDFGAIHSVQQPAYGNGRVFVLTGGHQDSFLWGFDAASGTERIRTPFRNQWARWLAPVVADGGVYAGSGNVGGMARFDAATGEESYFVERPQHDQWTPAVANGLVFSFNGTHDADAGLVAAHASTGAQAYRIADARLPLSGTPVVTAGNRVLTSFGNRLLAVDLGSRAVAWSHQGSGDFFFYMPAVSDGVVYMVAGGNVEARRESDGSFLWSWAPPLGNPRGNLVVAKNVLFVAGDNKTYAIDLAARRHTWSYPAFGQLSVSRDGLLFIARTDGKVTAIDLR
jgi:hypothetical protein